MAKKYIDAELTIVRLQGDVIATSLGNGGLESRGPEDDNVDNNFAPERRYRNGHYSEDYGFRD